MSDGTGRRNRRVLMPEQFLDVVNEIEGAFPVEEWRAAGVHLWPVVRARSMRYVEGAKASVAPGDGGSQGGAFASARRVIAGAGTATLTNLADRGNRVPRRLRRADVLLLSDAVSRVLINGVWYDRFVDPVVETLAELGASSVQLQPYHWYRRPRASPSRLVQPGLDLLDAWTRYTPLTTSLEATGWESALARLRERGVPAPAVDASSVRREATLIALTAQRFLRMFHRVEPRLALHVDYGVPAMAFAVAARCAGVPSVEIQHAMPSPTHPMYARWTKVPGGGYDVLPAHYWVWRAPAAEVLRQWAHRVEGGPRVIVGGNPWLDRWLTGQGTLVRQYDARMEADKSRGANRRHVLLTFETTFTRPAILAQFLEAVAATADSVQWWFRLHPTMLAEESGRVRSAISSHRAGPVMTDMTDEPLYALLRHVDGHVTYSSSTTQEAAMFGVPTLLMAPHAATVYPDLVRSGWAAVCVDAAAIVDAVVALERRTPEPEVVLPIGADAALRQLLNP